MMARITFPLAHDNGLGIGGVPRGRVRLLNSGPMRPEGAYVLYWMTATRRLAWNFALQRAVGWAVEFHRPLVVVEVLGCGGRWDTGRHHRFVLQGMADNAQQALGKPLLYYPYVEPKPGEALRLLAGLAPQACMIVTDEYPILLSSMIGGASGRSRSSRNPAGPPTAETLPVRVEAIDSCGLLPIRLADQVFPTAFAFRRFLQRVIREQLLESPGADPWAGVPLPVLQQLPEPIYQRWPPASAALLKADPEAIRRLPIDQQVPASALLGGRTAALERWKRFLSQKLADYSQQRNHPDAEGTSGLSPYLHYGYISTHEIFFDIAQKEQWQPDRLASRPTGRREGFWGLSQAAETFLDQLVTWRELGFNFCAHRSDYDQYDSLPDWAKQTLAKHKKDPRPYRYSLHEFTEAKTHDPIWNAAQGQLAQEGQLHNYLRMLWGKKILEWTASPEEALDIMIELNNRFGLDGQDPNSYTGIFWILGRYDRPWGPERPIFGTIRYMSSENTARKVRLRKYLARYGFQSNRQLWEGSSTSSSDDG
ncbi:MAG: deoxyribodipyrimidine photolyase [Thermoguttaceae bacterium]|nr:deoxyribodipyrimidine photolyase [Thermoguttaceae bacterium]MDW8039219.1 deoxyribodipyrimidine photolyase [Thermoguttaceae bacterium]